VDNTLYAGEIYAHRQKGVLIAVVFARDLDEMKKTNCAKKRAWSKPVWPYHLCGLARLQKKKVTDRSQVVISSSKTAGSKAMADAKPPTLYRDSGIERSININEHSSQRQIAIHDYYDINNTAEIILKYDFKRVIHC
jgi:hypothetical protein